MSVAETVSEPPRRTAGRPSNYSEATANTICRRLADGESLRTICRDADMPGKSTVMEWLEGRPEFRTKYAHARELQADTLADETLDIADDASNDWMERLGEDGQSLGWKENGESVQRSKLRIEQRKWYAAKLAPKKYGERQILEHAGTVTHEVRAADTIDARLLSPEDREALKQALVDALAQQRLPAAIEGECVEVES